MAVLKAPEAVKQESLTISVGGEKIFLNWHLREADTPLPRATLLFNIIIRLLILKSSHGPDCTIQRAGFGPWATS